MLFWRRSFPFVMVKGKKSAPVCRSLPSAGAASSRWTCLQQVPPFKRPEGSFAGTLIEETGLKGFRVGGAVVSEKHAGFIVNLGGATANDVLTLIEEVKRRVYERTGVVLEPEVRIL